LRDYLDSPREIYATDPIKWWGVRNSSRSFYILYNQDKHHAQQYPTLSRMARDYLAVQGSSVASERAFSSAGLTDDLRCNRMEVQAFGKLQILKYAYRTNFLNGSEEAAMHEPFLEVEIE
jgi:hypothetical protein